jgi:twitching motility protein PilT
MAIVDALLKLLAVRGADSLRVRSGEVPHLTRDGTKMPLSMPVPGADVIATIIGEVANDELREALASGDRIVAHYRGSDGSRFAVEIERSGEVYDMCFRPGVGVEPPALTEPRRSRPETSAYRSGGGMDELLDHAQRLDASDVIVSSSGPARVRVGGALRRVDGTNSEDVIAFLGQAMGDPAKAAFELSGSCDIAFTSARGTRYRVNVFKQDRGVAAAFRPIRDDAPTLASLNLPDDFHQLVSHRSGLVLLVGTAGSGKSTTLVALIEHLNNNADKHIITLEDPIEYSYAPKRCLIHQRELGRHVADFGTGLRAALRESPDVILVGEMRDRDTIAAAITAAETGHLVLSTLHSGSAAMAVDRIIDVFPEQQQAQVRYQLADVLRAVVTQVLLPSTNPPLRVPAYEKLEVTSAVSTKIRDNRTHQIETELQKGRAQGMVALELSLARLVRKNLLSRDAARAIASDGLYLDQLIASG